MSPVSFLDLGATYRELRAELDAAVARVLASGWYILGPEVDAFEQAFAAHAGAKHCVSVANGLDALEIGLLAAGVGAGDEVIVPSNTYIATWLAVTHVGATPVPVEPDEATHNLDPRRIEAALTPRTRAILPVHLYGRPADMQPIVELARSRGLFVLDDAAQAHGATYRGRRVGALAGATAWSFYPGKNLGAFGDAGAITTDDDTLAERVRVLRNYGSRVKYHNEVVGLNSRLDPIQAAVLAVKLPHLDAWNQRRERIAALYDEGLAGLDWLGLPSWQDDRTRSALHLYVVRTPRRDELQQHLNAAGVQTLIHYPIPPHRQPAYASLGLAEGSFPVAERLAREVLSLPIGPHLSTEDAARVVAAVRSFGER